jgi:hypothetical protein
VTLLTDPAARLRPGQLLDAKRSLLTAPGLYSWWVDDAGAADLTAGADLSVQPGLIYAGLAGATRWPSGRRSGRSMLMTDTVAAIRACVGQGQEGMDAVEPVGYT